VISPTQRPLPDNTQHSTRDRHARSGNRTHNPSKRAAADALDLAATGIDSRLVEAVLISKQELCSL